MFFFAHCTQVEHSPYMHKLLFFVCLLFVFLLLSRSLVLSPRGKDYLGVATFASFDECLRYLHILRTGSTREHAGGAVVTSYLEISLLVMVLQDMHQHLYFVLSLLLWCFRSRDRFTVGCVRCHTPWNDFQSFTTPRRIGC